MSDKIDNIAHKIDLVSDKVSEMSTKLEVHIAKFDIAAADAAKDRVNISKNTDVLEANTGSLNEHMKRTDILEQYVKKIDERFTPVEMESIRKKAVADYAKARIILLGKLGGAIGALGALAGIVKFLIQHL